MASTPPHLKRRKSNLVRRIEYGSTEPNCRQHPSKVPYCERWLVHYLIYDPCGRLHFQITIYYPSALQYHYAIRNPPRDKKMIIVHARNYGTLAHWRWPVQSYGREGVCGVKALLLCSSRCGEHEGPHRRRNPTSQLFAISASSSSFPVTSRGMNNKEI
jgi:hypothetical protein